MNDSVFQRWSETLAELRRTRQDGIAKRLQETVDPLSAKEFFEICGASLDAILEQWFVHEQQSWEAQTPDDPSTALITIKKELRAALDFEKESIERDLEATRNQSHWTNDSAYTEAEAQFYASASE